MGSELRSAARDANISRLKELVEAGADVNYLGVWGQPALCPLIFKFFDKNIDQREKNKAMECVEMLLESGANPNIGSPAPFELAVELRNRIILNSLISHGAHVNTVYTRSGMTPLHLTLLQPEKGSFVDAGCAIDLITGGADLTARDNSGLLPIHLACKGGYLHELKEILDRRPQDVNERDNDGFTPLVMATAGGHGEAVRLLLSFGAQPSENQNNMNEVAFPEESVDKLGSDAEIAQSLDLSVDDAAYLKWARDLGFDREVEPPRVELENDDDHVPSVRNQIDSWFDEFYVPVIDALWKKYVPKSGACTVLQGELARCIGQLEGELFKNGMMNMGDGYYDHMVDKIKETCLRDGRFSPFVQKVLEMDALVVKGADYAEIVSSFSIFHPTGVEVSLNRVKMVVAAWCVANPEPMKFTSSVLD